MSRKKLTKEQVESIIAEIEKVRDNLNTRSDMVQGEKNRYWLYYEEPQEFFSGFEIGLNEVIDILEKEIS